MLRVAGYIRVSTEEQRDHGFSLAAQRRAIAAYCEMKEWELVQIYADEGLSGKDLNRPALLEFLQVLHRGEYQVVMITRLDRLSRTTVQLLGMVQDYFTANGVRLVSITEGLDPTTAAGEFVLTILAGLAQMERKQLAERVREGMAEAKRQGKHMGRPPYGCRIGPTGALVPELSEQFLLERARRLVREFGYPEAARQLGWPYNALWGRVQRRHHRGRDGWPPA